LFRNTCYCVNYYNEYGSFCNVPFDKDIFLMSGDFNAGSNKFVSFFESKSEWIHFVCFSFKKWYFISNKIVNEEYIGCYNSADKVIEAEVMSNSYFYFTVWYCNFQFNRKFANVYG
jgi:hypothetical protein